MTKAQPDPDKQHVVLMVYNSYRDPLCAGFFMSYIRRLCDGHRVFHLITFEQPGYAMDASAQSALHTELSALNIRWYPLRYKTGRIMLVRKSLNFLEAFFLMARLRRRYRCNLVISLANIAGVIGYTAGRLLRMKNCILSYEPHSEFLADFGLLSRQSVRYKILHALEMRAGKRSEFIITGTAYMAERLLPVAKGQVSRAPSAIDGGVFYFDPTAREQLRGSLGIGEETTVVIYAGKTGGLYLPAGDLARLMTELKPQLAQGFLLIVSPDDPGMLRDSFAHAGADMQRLHITRAHTPEEMRGWYSASDLGLSAVPPLPAQRYRSPVKVGEYLMCGLPYLTFPGVSEDDQVALAYETGVVMTGDMAADGVRARDLLSVPRATLRQRCRAAGEAYRGMAQPIALLSAILDACRK